jgi:hypothetical protein
LTGAHLLLPVALLTLAGCADTGLLSGGWLSRRQASTGSLMGSEQRRDPALSGNGRLLASISDRQGRSSVILQEQPSGRLLPLRHLRGHSPHRSPALSWNGRYLAVLMQQGMQTVAVVEDRLRGQLLRLPAPAGASVERLIDLYAAQGSDCEGLIVTQGGHYAGVVGGLLLLRLAAERDTRDALARTRRLEHVTRESGAFRADVEALIADLVAVIASVAICSYLFA